MIWDSEPGNRKRSRMSCTTHVVWLYSASVLGRVADPEVSDAELWTAERHTDSGMAIGREAHVLNFYRIMRTAAAVAAWSVALAGMAYAQCDASHYKEGEYDMYSQASKDVQGSAFDKAIGELN